MHGDVDSSIRNGLCCCAEVPTLIVAVSDFMRAVPEQIARFSPRKFNVLGTDGMGRSDTREALRSFFETNMEHIVVAVLEQLAAEGAIERTTVAEAIAAYGLDADVDAPWQR